MSNSKRERNFLRVLALLRAKAGLYFLAALVNATILGFSFNLVLAFIQRDVTNAAVSGQEALLERALILAAVTFISGVPLLIVARYVIAWFEKRAMTQLRTDSFHHIVNLPIRHFDEQHSGDLLSRTTNDLNTIGAIFRQLIPSLLFGLVLGLVGLISILILNWQLGLFALVIGLATTGLSTAFAVPLREKSVVIQESLSDLTQRLSDVLQGLTVTKMFHLEEVTHRHYAQVNQRVTEATIDHAITQAKYEAWNSLISWMRSIGTLVFGLFLLSEGNVAMGAIVAAIHLQSNASFMFTNLGDFITGIQKSLVGSARVFELLSWRPEQNQRLAPVTESGGVATAESMIQVRSLSFSYDDEGGEASAMLLDRIDLKVAEGQFAALVGPSGGGKSTLIKLLLGLYPETEGDLVVAGKPVGEYTLNELRSLMAYVPQDAYLFDGTIEENIGYGRPEATHEEILAAATAAYAHDFILDQPEGYQTLVGERGARLSGGQRQRIAIARALLKDAPILLLDEATSALDSESEAIVQKALEVLMKGRTTIAIAHRLSTIQHADTIYVMRAGRVVETGNHQALLAQQGEYHALYALQETRDRAS